MSDEMIVRTAEVVELQPATEASPIGTLAGYFTRFDQAVKISDREGTYLERIAPGAFARAVERYDAGKAPQVLFHHGLDPRVGVLPLGVPTVFRVDDVGVYAEVPLDDTSFNRDLAASLRSGAMRGQSFAARVTRSTWSEDRSTVVRDDLDLIEFGPTPFPAFDATSATLRTHLHNVLGDVAEKASVSVAEPPVAATDTTTPTVRAGSVLPRLAVLRARTSR